jgi:hypothetical protein
MFKGPRVSFWHISKSLVLYLKFIVCSWRRTLPAPGNTFQDLTYLVSKASFQVTYKERVGLKGRKVRDWSWNCGTERYQAGSP